MSGKTYWRGLAEYADTAEFRAWAEREFPTLLTILDRAGTSRRRLLQLMGASLALAGLGGCRRKDHRILPYGAKPPELAPGVPLYYASTFLVGGEPIGVLAETHEGRPTKLEGNPAHPASRGALPALGQAAVLDLYDPDRSRYVTRRGAPARFEEDLLPALDDLAKRFRARRGAGLAILRGKSASPAVALLEEQLARTMPDALVSCHEPLEPEPLPWEARLDLEQARVIICLDADPLLLEDRGVRAQRGFARGRDPDGDMSRLYVVEPHMTVTGAAADHRLRVAAHAVHGYALRLAQTLGVEDLPDATFDGAPRWLTAVAADLRRAGARALVVAGRRQPAAVHALARAMNERLASGAVRYVRPAETHPGIAELAARMRGGAVEALFVLGTNPVYDAPVDLGFEEQLARVPVSIHLGVYRDETAAGCTWHVPEAHFLETWGDARTGAVLSPIQPMIAPLHGGRSALELLARMTGHTPTDPYAIVRDSFRRLTGADDFETRWRRFLHEGVFELEDDGEDATPLDPALVRAPPRAPDIELEVCFVPSAAVWDGRFANNAWLQETPDPVTKLVWDNAAVVAPATAKRLGVDNGDVLAIESEGRTLEAPAFVLPGAVQDSLQLTLGYGRTCGALARQAGFDAYRLRTSGAPGFGAATATRTGKAHRMATTQEHWAIDTVELVDGELKERGIVREATLPHYRAHKDFAAHQGPHHPPLTSIFQTPEFTGEHQWGMAIDLNRCTGCNACAAACQAENNIPVVGKDEVIRGREMSWMRIDRYFRGDPEGEVGVSYQPMPCQHCEHAPCETVCPVNATVHSGEGLNVMTYNRCIGTRYCANNCPYKVRRFNFYDYNKDALREGTGLFDGDPVPNPGAGWSRPQPMQSELGELLRMQKNPDVTVRMRGVMEKCTFCVQRLQAAKIRRKVEAGQTKAGKVPDGTLLTACQQSCPSAAIVFGDLSDPKSRVSRAKANARDYAVLGFLNTKPRTTYLARVRNVNPELEESHG
jgi:molybdopterin-containing oxidoreductase family iron-sulfur binding subunit